MFVRNPQSLPAGRRAQPEISNAMLYACPLEAELLAVGGRYALRQLSGIRSNWSILDIYIPQSIIWQGRVLQKN